MKNILLTAIFAFSLYLFCGAILIINPNLYTILTEESKWFELLTAILYLGAGGILIYAATKQYKINKNVIFIVLLGLFFIFIAGEEESWGQWFFEYDVPESIKAVNVQNETTIHNLEIFTGVINSHTMLNLFIIGFGIVLPLLYKFSTPIRRLADTWSVPVSTVPLIPIFIFGFVFNKVARLDIITYAEPWRHTEVMEMFFAIGMFAFASTYLKGRAT